MVDPFLFEVFMCDQKNDQRVSSRLYPVAISMFFLPNHGFPGSVCQEWGAKLLGLQHFHISMLVFKVVILNEIVCVSATTGFGSTKKTCRLYRLSSNLPFSLCSKRPLTSPFANGRCADGHETLWKEGV